MADSRIEGSPGGSLTELTSPAADDRYVIDDDSADATKYIKHENIFKTIADDKFTLQDNSDASKQLQFQLSGITASNTRVLTVPDFDGTIATLTGTETLSGKTLTTPTINGAVIGTSLDMNGTELILDADADTSLTADTDDQIDVKLNGADDFRFVANTFRALSGSTIETDTLNETTSANGVSIDGMTIKDGLVVGASGKGVDNDSLNTAAGKLGAAWQSWVPSVTQLGSVIVTNTASKYIQIGKTVIAVLNLTVTGSGTGANNIIITLPVTAARTGEAIGDGYINNVDVAVVYKLTAQATTTGSFIGIWGTGTGAAAGNDPNFSLASGDTITFSLIYEGA